MLSARWFERERVAWMAVLALMTTALAWLFLGSLLIAYQVVAAELPVFAVVVRALVRTLFAVGQIGLPVLFATIVVLLVVAGLAFESPGSRRNPMEVRRG
jgi:hypothetical protein